MKVVLARPWNKTSMLIPNHGLGYLAASVHRNGHAAIVIDCIRDKLQADNFADRMREIKPDIIGFQVYTFDLPILDAYLQALCHIDAILIAGGPHPSAAPSDMCRRFPGIQLFIRGEAEQSLPRLLDAISAEGKIPPQNILDSIPGLFTHETPVPEAIPCAITDDLDAIGFPDWDQISPNDYPVAPQGTFTRRLPVAPIIITRGCPYPCTFCAGKLISGHRIRTRSVDHVIEELRMLKRRFGIREFHIQDDNFTFYREYVIEFCHKLTEAGLDLVWACPNGIRLDSLDEDVLRAMDRAGCYSVAVGIESGSQRILDLMRKQTTLNDLVWKVQQIKRVTSWYITGFFILGYPGETPGEMEATIRLSRRLPLDKANFGILMPLPGTQAETAALDMGWHPDTDLLRMSEYRSPFTPKGLTQTEFRRMFRRAFVGFYARPRIIWSFLRQIKSIDQIRILWRRLKDVILP
ncbi:B12-binding domain-containing radical SAM protein [bacterium]|nr:B12-binding domain-containing radical SAM protein [candidate division CSSED10-310 bacterium]